MGKAWLVLDNRGIVQLKVAVHDPKPVGEGVATAGEVVVAAGLCLRPFANIVLFDQGEGATDTDEYAHID